MNSQKENLYKYQKAKSGITDTAFNERMVDKAPKSDSKDSRGEDKNDGSEMLDSDGKEDELDTLEKEYNEEYYVDSDGLQRFGKNRTSDSAKMSYGSDTDGTNKSGSARMSRGKSSEQDDNSDPQIVRGVGVKKKIVSKEVSSRKHLWG